MAELLKTIQMTFDRHSTRISDVIAHATQHIAFLTISTILKVKVASFTL